MEYFYIVIDGWVCDVTETILSFFKLSGLPCSILCT